MSTLELQNLSKHFGALAAISNVTFSVTLGERIGILGPNGAGKTTLFNLIGGQIVPDKGSRLVLGGQDITGRPPHVIAAEGIVRTFQKNSIFVDSSVYENIRLTVNRRMGVHFRMLKSAERDPAVRRETEKAMELVRLTHRSDSRASELSYGEQRQLELGIALAAEPKFLLLDEPTSGISAKESQEVATMLDSLSRDIALVIIEHDVDIVTSLVSRLIVLNFGNIIADGPVAEVRENREVLAAYLGGA